MNTRALCVAVFLGVVAAPVVAEEEPATKQPLQRVALMEVLEAVSKNTDRVFVVDDNVFPNVVVGQLVPRKMDYSALLVVLRSNKLAAVQYENAVSIINVATVRQHPFPILYAEDDSIADEAWVTMIVKVKNAKASGFVPLLRPMMPQPAHMVAHPESNMITLVDRYANVKRILALIRRMDDGTASR